MSTIAKIHDLVLYDPSGGQGVLDAPLTPRLAVVDRIQTNYDGKDLYGVRDVGLQSRMDVEADRILAVFYGTHYR